MAILKLKPAYKEYIWGGTRLMQEFHKDYSGEKLAESWELSCHRDGQSVIRNGSDCEKPLGQYVREHGKDVLGTNCRKESEFPILIKLIDAKERLSVQVHPDDHYAREMEGQKGKTEMWYIVDCGPDACLYYGFSQRVSQEEFEKRIKENTLTEVLNKIRVRKGDVLLIEAGTIHAIGENILVAEIQENSNVTYRIYDYGRVGKDGKQRNLDIEKAQKVLKMNPVVLPDSFSPHLAVCDYFTVDKLFLDGVHMRTMSGFAGQDSFVHFLILDGEGTISTLDDIQTIRKGDSVLLPAGSGTFQVEGRVEALMTRI
ncbi:MAG: class I mannose-6-phosphate isomerase [Lachnospiraceae bacterium]|nr:class I mannose-6-phosphate isomerase [Lachnospiraceae bacterium]